MIRILGPDETLYEGDFCRVKSHGPDFCWQLIRRPECFLMTVRALEEKYPVYEFGRQIGFENPKIDLNFLLESL